MAVQRMAIQGQFAVIRQRQYCAMGTFGQNRQSELKPGVECGIDGRRGLQRSSLGTQALGLRLRIRGRAWYAPSISDPFSLRGQCESRERQSRPTRCGGHVRQLNLENQSWFG